MKTIINRRTNRRSLWLAALMIGSSVAPQIADATIVQIETNMGVIEINLFDNDTPATVANFLFYVNNGRYINSIFHRSAEGFVLQGGGFTFDSMVPFNDILTQPAVVNEPVFSNVLGTIAMAKLGSGPDPINSATSQWYINLGDNSANLDEQNGGFTVFGQVTDSGMTVVNEIAALATFDFTRDAFFSAGGGGAFADVPLLNFTVGASFDEISRSNLVIVTSITVDSTVDTAAGLNPVLNSSNSGGGTDPGAPPADNGGGGGGGGGFGFLMLFALLLTWRYRQV